MSGLSLIKDRVELIKDRVELVNKPLERVGEEERLNIMYEMLYEESKGADKNKISQMLKDKAYGFGHSLFDETRKKQEEQDGFIENPFEVAEGIFTCGKCGGTRTYSYAKQVRSCDEGMSVFVTCVKCKHKWMHSG